MSQAGQVIREDIPGDEDIANLKYLKVISYFASTQWRSRFNSSDRQLKTASYSLKR